MTYFCTTCGNLEYRKAIGQLAGPLGGGLANALEDIEPEQLMLIPHWDDAVEIAVHDLPLRFALEGILESWLSRHAQNTAFLDFALYKIVRHLSIESPLRVKWIAHCRSLAVGNRDFSLTESLVLILGKRALDDPELVSQAKEFARSSSQMRRVLHNACNVDVQT